MKEMLNEAQAIENKFNDDYDYNSLSALLSFLGPKSEQ